MSRTLSTADESLAGALLEVNNLSDVASPAAARANLELGSVATQNSDAVSFTGGSMTGVSVPADDVTISPAGGIAATDVQAALQELDTEKAPKDGAVMINVDINSGAIDGTDIGQNQAAAGNFISVSVSGDLTVGGNLVVNGTTTTVNSTTVETADNTILLNKNEVGAGVTAGVSGIEIERGSLPNYLFTFDETSDTFKVGEVGSLQSVATRDENPTDDAIPNWDAATNKFVAGAGSPKWDGAKISVVGAAKVEKGVPFVAVSTTTKTLSTAEAGEYVRFTNAGGCTLTVPLEATVSLPVGYEVSGIAAAAGQVTIAPEGGVTLNSVESKRKTRLQFSGFTLKKIATNEWDLIGDLAA